MPINLDDILREAVAKGASDIHLKVGVPAYNRIHGALMPVSKTPTTKAEMDVVVNKLLESMLAGKERDKAEIDVAYTLPGVSRFRCNIFRQRGTYEVVMRTVPYNIPTVEELGLPPVLNQVSLEARGLVLVTGITGSGKSTTIASMVNNMNKSMPVHIVTIEDPIEFVYRDEMASVTQREVGIDTETFHDALKYVLRQDPDVIVLGEMRDKETASVAMTAAETGHLVMSTLHTADAVQTIDRIVDMFPAEQQDQIRHQLGQSLKAIISMRLIPKAEGGGMVPAVEVLINTPAISSLIEENKLGDIKGLITEGASQYGMQTFDQSLLALYNAKLITKESALEEASSSAELELAMRGITAGTASAHSFMKSESDGARKSQAKEYYMRAARQLETGLLDKATENVKQALRYYPAYEEAKELAAKIEARAKLEATRVQSGPAIKMALDMIGAGNLEGALVALKNALTTDPTNEKITGLIKGTQEKMEALKNVKPMMDAALALEKQGKLEEALSSYEEVFRVDPGLSEAYKAAGEVAQALSRRLNAAEVEVLSAKADEASTGKRWFDAVNYWVLVRKVQPDFQRAIERLTEAGASLKAMGLPGLPAQAPWAAGVKASFEKGLVALLGGQAVACMNEWKGATSKIPEAGPLLDPFIMKVKEICVSHIAYHIDKARSFNQAGDLGRAIMQLRYVFAIDPQNAEARAVYDTCAPAAEKRIKESLAEADKWMGEDRPRQALYYYERALDIDPSREALKQKVAELRVRVEKRAEAASATVK